MILLPPYASTRLGKPVFSLIAIIKSNIGPHERRSRLKNSDFKRQIQHVYV